MIRRCITILNDVIRREDIPREPEIRSLLKALDHEFPERTRSSNTLEDEDCGEEEGEESEEETVDEEVEEELDSEHEGAVKQHDGENPEVKADEKPDVKGDALEQKPNDFEDGLSREMGKLTLESAEVRDGNECSGDTRCARTDPGVVSFDQQCVAEAEAPTSGGALE